MEALATFGLACNVIQVIEFSFKVIRLSGEVYINGSPEGTKTVKENAKCMMDAAEKTIEVLSQSTRSFVAVTTTGTDLWDIATKCVDTANTIQKGRRSSKRTEAMGHETMSKQSGGQFDPIVN